VRRLAATRGSVAGRSRSARVAAATSTQRRSWIVGTAAAVLLTTVGGLALMRHYEAEASAQFAALSAELHPEPAVAAATTGKAGSKAGAKPAPKR